VSCPTSSFGGPAAAPRIVTYSSIDADCPPSLRAVAHCFAISGVSGRFQLLPATQIGPDAWECAARLAAFLEAEVARERRREENAKAAGEHKRTWWATRKGES
jgi:hypothetical protein